MQQLFASKSNLFIEFEKVIDSIVRQDYNRQHIRFKEKQSKLSSKMTELNRTKELHFKETSHEHDMKVQQVNAKYEINDYWLDIGRIEDYKKAQIDYKSLFKT